MRNWKNQRFEGVIQRREDEDNRALSDYMCYSEKGLI